MTSDQQGVGTAPHGSSQMPIEKEVANLMETMSHTTVIVAIIVFGLLLDFIGQLVLIGSPAPGTVGYSAAEVLGALGSFIILVVLFAGGIMKRDMGDYVRAGMLITAGLLFLATVHLI